MKEDKELPHGRETEVSKLSVDFIQAQMTRIYSFKRLGNTVIAKKNVGCVLKFLILPLLAMYL